MNSRERVIKAINHIEPDKVPIDLGAGAQSGISASTLYQFASALGIEAKAIKIIEPFQLLGEVEDELLKKVGADVVGLWNPVNFMGTRNDNWKPWTMPDGTPTLMAGTFEFDLDKEGNTLAYPQGDRNCDYSMKLTIDGTFFNSIDRVPQMNESDLDAYRDFKNSFGLFDDTSLKMLESQSLHLHKNTDYAVFGNFGGGGFGDVAAIPGHFLKSPKGVRRLDDWMMCHLLYPDYIKQVFDLQLEVALKNLKLYHEAVGDRIQIIAISGTDFGTQNGEFISLETYRSLYKPYHKAINDWVHTNTKWKTFYHSCGSIVNLIEDFVEAGVDILNPVQCSAFGMDPQMLKDTYGDRIVFWGGGVDTQHTLPFGNVEDVRKEVAERVAIFGKGGGYVFNTIHNIVANTPIENIIAMYQTVNKHR